MEQKKYDNVRIASCWDLQGNGSGNIYEQIAWYFAGGVFGGDKDALNLFSIFMKNKCVSIINEKKSSNTK